MFGKHKCPQCKIQKGYNMNNEATGKQIGSQGGLNTK